MDAWMEKTADTGIACIALQGNDIVEWGLRGFSTVENHQGISAG